MTDGIPQPQARDDPERLAAALRAVIRLAVEQMAEAEDGGFIDADTIWPSQIIEAVNEAMGR